MKLTAKSRYATRILLDLALKGSQEPTSTAELSKATEVSVQFIEQIMRPLKKAGLIVSVRGAGGGHMLAKPPAEVTIGDIVRAVAGPITIASCLEPDETCTKADTCLTRTVWQRASKAMERELDSITIDELVKSQDPACL